LNCRDSFRVRGRTVAVGPSSPWPLQQSPLGSEQIREAECGTHCRLHAPASISHIWARLYAIPPLATLPPTHREDAGAGPRRHLTATPRAVYEWGCRRATSARYIAVRVGYRSPGRVWAKALLGGAHPLPPVISSNAGRPPSADGWPLPVSCPRKPDLVHLNSFILSFA